MKKVFLTLGITSILVLLVQNYSMSEIYAITEESNTTMNIDADELLESGIKGNTLEGAALGLVENATDAFKFDEIIAEGKSTLLRVSEIEPNTPIKYNTITCLMTQSWSTGSVSEHMCDAFGVITVGENIMVNNNTQYIATPAVSSSLLTAISQGIEKRIDYCFVHRPTSMSSFEGMSEISTVNCHNLYVLYN